MTKIQEAKEALFQPAAVLFLLLQEVASYYPIG
jgi:hypothetical protein